MPLLFPLRVYYIAAALLLAGLAVTVIHRAEFFDEAWFAEQSYWLLKEGIVRSELFRGYNGWEKQLYVYHKLFIYAGAGVMYLTGFTVAGCKVVSIAFGTLCGGLIWAYGKNSPPEQRWLSMVLYIGSGTLIRYVAVNRPEAMYMALGFASWFALDPPAKTPSPRPVAAGILAGMAALTHLNGVIYLIAGTLFVVIKYGWRPAALFVIAGALTLSLYFTDALLNGDLALMVSQFRNDPATQLNQHIGNKLMLLLGYHRIFFHSGNELALSVLVLLCGFAFRKKLNFSQPVLLYTALLIVSFWILTKSNTDMYFLLFMPWLVLLASNWLIAYMADEPVWIRKSFQFLVFAYCAVGVVQMTKDLRENRKIPAMESHNALVASQMPKHHARVIAPIEFFFGQMDNYRIQGLTVYHLRERETGKIPLEQFFQDAARDSVEYIISDQLKRASYTIPADAPEKIGGFHRVFADQVNTVYARDLR